MKRVMLVVGARPNLMKAPALMAAMTDDARFITRLVHTGQHYDDNMSKCFFEDLELPQPDVNLGIGSGTPAQQIARILLALEPEVDGWEPDLVAVVGDVNSTLAAALLTNKLCIPLAHIEAGLRSFDRTMPEEFNRIITDSLADYLFTPSKDADENLLREGIPPDRIFFVGNVMVDTLLRFHDRARQLKTWSDYNLQPKTYAVLTLHRPSNVDERESLVQVLNLLKALQTHLPIVFPIHPRTQARLDEFGLASTLAALPNIIAIPPLRYLSFLSLMTEARLVLTDSGGIQEETTVLGVPCLTLRGNTERPITISEGTNHLVGTNPEHVLAAFKDILGTSRSLTHRLPELWDGKAAHRIIEILGNEG